MPRQPMTQTLNITAARSQLSELVNQVFRRDVRIIIQKSGLPAAALISTKDVARLDEYDRQRQADFAVLADIQNQFADVPIEEHEQEVARAVREARERMAEREAQPSTPHGA